MRCPRCGNENPGTNRFCGMCGATLLQPGETAASARAVEPPSRVTPSASVAPAATPSAARTEAPQAPVTRAPVVDDTPTISGPSFLGLNQPAPAQTPKRGSLSIDPSAAPSSRSLDYLLEDEEPKGGGGGKFVVILVVLALAAGLGYWRWKNGSFPSLLSSTRKPAATQPAEDGSTDSPAPTSAAAPAPSGNTSAGPTSAQPATTPGASAAPASQPTANQPASQPTSGDPSDSSGSPASATPPTEKSAEAPAENVPPAVKPKPRPADPVAAAEPPRPVRTVDPVAEAQKYLYGKGVKQDCDRGMRLLKPAADKANPKAMIEMGALYSAGLCAPRDLPTAYRWFAMALHKDPENQAVQTDLQKLWSEMTQPERQLAIRLSQ